MKGDYTLRWQVEDILHADESGHTRIPTEDVKSVLREVQIQQIALELENRELRQSQRRLRESRDRYRQHFELIPDGCLVLDADQTIREANEAATQLLDRQHSELTGASWQDFIHADDWPEWERRRQQSSDGRTDHEFRLSMGRRVRIRRTVCRKHGVWQNAPEAVLLVIQSAQCEEAETTTAADGDETSAESVSDEQPYRVAINAASEAVIGLSADAIVRSWNPAAERMFGYAADDIQGSSILRLAPAEREQELRDVYAAIRSAVPVMDHATQQRTKTGQLRDVVLNIRQLPNASENAICAWAMIRDVTELMQTRDELCRRNAEAAQTSRMNTMGEMVAILIHEVSQPLTVVSALSQTCLSRLAQEQCADDPLRQSIQQLAEQASRASSIIRNVKRYLIRGTAGRAPVSVSEEIHHACRLVQNRIDAQQTVVKMRVDDSLPTVHADSLQIQQVLVNLLLNGLESMSEVEPHRRQIVIEARALKDQVQVRVSDVGRGISPEEAEKVFEPRFSTKSDGLGMGLTICDRVVKEHGGVLSCTRNPDTGMTFQFVLPSSDQPVTEDTGSSSTADDGY